MIYHHKTINGLVLLGKPKHRKHHRNFPTTHSPPNPLKRVFIYSVDGCHGRKWWTNSRIQASTTIGKSSRDLNHRGWWSSGNRKREFQMGKVWKSDSSVGIFQREIFMVFFPVDFPPTKTPWKPPFFSVIPVARSTELGDAGKSEPPGASAAPRRYPMDFNGNFEEDPWGWRYQENHVMGPYIGHKYGRNLPFRFLKWPLIIRTFH